MQKQQQNTESPVSSYTSSPGSFYTISREGSFHTVPPYQTQDQQTQDQQTQYQRTRRQQQRKNTFETVLPPSDVFQQTQYQKTRRQQQQQRKQVDRKYEQYKARKQLPGSDVFHQTQQEKFLKQINHIIVTQRQQATKQQLEKKKQQYRNIFGRNYIEPTKDSQYNLSRINKSLNRQGR